MAAQGNGPTQAMNLDQAVKNKAMVADVVQSILVHGEMKRITEFMGTGGSIHLHTTLLLAIA